MVADIGNGRELPKLYVGEMDDPNRENASKRAYQLHYIENGAFVSKACVANTTWAQPKYNCVASFFSFGDILCNYDCICTERKENPKSSISVLTIWDFFDTLRPTS